MNDPMTELDAIVIGGGPAGSTAATLLARDGRRVLLLEREKFPRYHIGESLLPATVHGIAELLGVADEVHRAGFVRKHGGCFRWGSSPEPWTFNFAEQLAAPGASYAYQVERAKFDDILLRNAARCGVDVREEASVLSSVKTGERFSGVRWQDRDGTEHETRAKFVIDASGGRGVFANEVGRREYDPFFRNLAVFGYFENGKRLPDPNRGNILTAAFDGGWIWYIPLSDTLTSVGAVIPKESVDDLRDKPLEESLAKYLARCPLVRDMLSEAKRVTTGMYGEVRLLRDFSYQNERYYANGCALIGDAACFIDPVFSSGVHLATFSGLLAARSVNSCLSGELDEEASFYEFERRYRREFGVFYQFLLGFYDLHRDPDSYFWNARKILAYASSDRDAFIRLVAGLSQAEDRFRSADEFLATTLDESRVLEAATTPHKVGREEVERHTASLFRERRELLGESAGPVFADGLVPSESRLRWARPSITP
jgi:FAD-dependent halogenase